MEKERQEKEGKGSGKRKRKTVREGGSKQRKKGRKRKAIKTSIR